MSVLVDMLSSALYSVLVLVALVFFYLAYTIVYLPNKIRSSLKQHPNIYFSPNSSFIGGDIAEYIAGKFEDKQHVFSRIEEGALKNPDKYDMIFTSAGPNSMLCLCSIEAMEEFRELVPHSIDRSEEFKHAIAKSALKSFGFIRSTENWQTRRKYMMSKIGIQQVSKKIPLILKSLEERFAKV